MTRAEAHRNPWTLLSAAIWGCAGGRVARDERLTFSRLSGRGTPLVHGRLRKLK